MDSLVRYAQEGNVAVLSLNRPKALNALNAEVCEVLRNEILKVQSNTVNRVVIIKGDDRNFAAGADIGSMAEHNPIEVESYVKNVLDCFNAIYECEIPVIASITGYTLGGGLELALACDIRFAGQKAKLGFPEVTLGIIPGGGGTQRLPRLIGTAKAKEIIMTGAIIDAQTALNLGIVNQVFPDEELYEKTLQFAKELATRPRQAIKRAKRAINASLDLDIRQGLMFETGMLLPLFSTHDQKEGMKAFLEKRKPEFIGK